MPARLDGLSFFFPALNEEDNVAPIVEEALSVLPRFADDLEIVGEVGEDRESLLHDGGDVMLFVQRGKEERKAV